MPAEPPPPLARQVREAMTRRRDAVRGRIAAGSLIAAATGGVVLVIAGVAAGGRPGRWAEGLAAAVGAVAAGVLVPAIERHEAARQRARRDAAADPPGLPPAG